MFREICVDGKFDGNTPATLKLPAGLDAILLKSPGHPYFTRARKLPKSGKLNLKAILDPSPNSSKWPAALLPLPPCASIPPLRRADQGFILFSFAPLAGPR